MKHSFFDKYSSVNSCIHRVNPKVKLAVAFGFILLFIYTPLKYFAIPVSLLLIFIFLSKVPFLYFIRQSLVALPFCLLGAVSGKWIVVLRAYFAVLVSILLSSTAKFSEILAALKFYRCPKIFLMVMAFMYRYFFVLVDELMRMRQAKDSRTLRKNNWQDIKIFSHLIGLLFVRAYERAERVYIAMCSRGFTGEIK